MNELAVHRIGLWIIVALRTRQLNCCRLDGCRLLRMHTGLIICLKCRQQLRLSALMWEHIGCLNPLDFQFNSTLTLIGCTIHKSKSTHFSLRPRQDANVSELTHGAQRRPSLSANEVECDKYFHSTVFFIVLKLHNIIIYEFFIHTQQQLQEPHYDGRKIFILSEIGWTCCCLEGTQNAVGQTK